MIYSNEHILYAIELRVLTYQCAGSLCKTDKNVKNALMYFDIHPWNSFFTNPYVVLPSDLISQMDKSMLRLFNSYVDLCNPQFTNDEISSIIKVCKKYSYEAIIHNNRISIRRYK